MKPFAALILAAGFSSRMGQLKPLLTLGTETIADHLISTFSACGADVYFLVGYRGDEVKSSIKSQGVTIVENPDYASGMFSSVQAGARALKPGHDAFFIMPVDIPFVSTDTIRKLMSAYFTHPGKIMYPVFGGRRGHPLLLPASLAPAIARWKQNGTLRDVLASYESLVVEITVPDDNILLDIDTEEDYRTMLERFKSR